MSKVIEILSMTLLFLVGLSAQARFNETVPLGATEIQTSLSPSFHPMVISQ